MMRGFAGAFVAVLLLAACTRVQSTATGGRNSWTIPHELRIGIPDEPDNLNPMFAHTAETDEVDQLILAPLFRYDDRGEFYPELATELPSYANHGISADGRTIVVHMRRGVVWSDGAPLDARDWMFTYRAVMNARNNTKLLFGWDNIASVRLVDRYTFIVKLKEPDADFLGLLAVGGSAYPPLPEHVLGKLPDLNRAPFNDAPLSSGPYLLERWNHGSSLEFVPNSRYWRGKPKLTHLTLKVIPNTETLFAQLQSHEIDVYPGVDDTQIDRMKALPGIAYRTSLVANWKHLGINMRRPGLRELPVRLAIAQGVDWKRINDTDYRGINILAHSDIFPESWAAPNVPLYKHDVAAAKRLLAQAGWTMGSDDVLHKGDQVLRLSISTGTAIQANNKAEVQIQQDLKPLGIDIEIKNYPVSLLFAQSGPLYTGQYDLEWSTDTNGADPDNEGNWSARFIPPKGANTSFLDDPEVTRLSREAKQTFDRAKRRALYQREEERLHALVPAVFFFWENQTSAWNSDVRNYKPAPYIANNWNSWEWDI